MSIFVSVIVPVYQVEQYLARCVESLLAQTYQEYEILLVDDGSRDAGGRMCDEYAKKHERVKVIHQENQGLGPARNNGVKYARGEYIVFVDSDDYVSEDYLEYLVYLTGKYHTKLTAVGGVSVWDDKKEERVFENPVDTEECLDTSEALKRMCYSRGFGVAAWGKLYHRSLVERFPYPACVHEDLATTYKIVSACEKIACSAKTGYFYYQRSSSLMHARVEEKHLYGITAAQEQLRYMEKYYPEVVPAAEYRCAGKLLEYIPRLLDRTAESKKVFCRIRREMKKYCRNILKNPEAETPFKIRCVAVSAGYRATETVWKLMEKWKEKQRKVS